MLPGKRKKAKEIEIRYEMDENIYFNNFSESQETTHRLIYVCT